MAAEDFFNAYKQGYVRVAALSLPLKLAQPLKNAESICASARELAKRGVGVVALPELCLTGYSLDDLFLQSALLDDTERALAKIAYELRDLPLMLVVGAPLRAHGTLFNCAVVISEGRLAGIVPKTYLPNYGEFYEKRYFSSAHELETKATWSSPRVSEGVEVPFGPLVFTNSHLPGLALGIEVCEDMWVPLPPATHALLAGANVIVNISGSPVTVGRSRERELLAQSASLRGQSAYIYAAAGAGESSNDLAWDGQTLIYELGRLLSAGERFSALPGAAVADVALWRIAAERLRNRSFADCAARDKNESAAVRYVQCARGPKKLSTLGTFEAQVANSARRPWGNGTLSSSARPAKRGRDVAQAMLQPQGRATSWAGKENGSLLNPPPLLHPAPPRFPFVPDDSAERDRDCYEAYNIQVAALMQRLEAVGGAKLVIGVSGGLDSTHALLVAAQAMDKLGRARSDILAYTLPGFATSAGTKSNAYALCAGLGIPCEEIDIRPLAQQMLSDLGHPAAAGQEVYDVTFENVQAGLRTDLLFRLANARGAIVLGTGDLSELALGWCTYGVGDQMSHYGINVGVPKTLIQHLIRWVAQRELFGAPTSEVLHAILDTEISPELVPVKEGEQIQSTQSTIGPYELHDFFLAYFLRGANVEQILFNAFAAWGDGELSGQLVCAPSQPVSLNEKRGESMQVAEPQGSRDESAGAERLETGETERSESEPTRYSLQEIAFHLHTFLRRFFASQFKRTCIPNGPKACAAGALSPRGDWRMPSDASAQLWLAQLKSVCAQLGIKL